MMIQGGKERRRLLVGAATIAGTVLTTDALSKIEPVYAAVKTALNFRERRKSIPANSPSLDTQVSTQSVSQGQPGNLQDTPTPDATVEAAQRDKIIQDDQKAQKDNGLYWLNTAAPLGAAAAIIGAAATIIGGGINYIQTQRKIREEAERQKEIDKVEREKRDEDRFNNIINKLSSINNQEKTNAAIQLRTFLDPTLKESYKRFYEQIFNLAVSLLRCRKVNPNNPEPDGFYLEIIKVFRQSVPLLRETLNLQSIANEQILDDTRRNHFDASGVRLDRAYLVEADLEYVYMTRASLKGAFLRRAHLEHAGFHLAHLEGASLLDAHLDEAYLAFANLTKANLTNAHLNGINEKRFLKTRLDEAQLIGADLTNANPENAILNGTNMYNVCGLTASQKDVCKSKGATFDPPQPANALDKTKEKKHS